MSYVHSGLDPQADLKYRYPGCTSIVWFTPWDLVQHCQIFHRPFKPFSFDVDIETWVEDQVRPQRERTLQMTPQQYQQQQAQSLFSARVSQQQRYVFSNDPLQQQHRAAYLGPLGLQCQEQDVQSSVAPEPFQGSASAKPHPVTWQNDAGRFVPDSKDSDYDASTSRPKQKGRLVGQFVLDTTGGWQRTESPDPMHVSLYLFACTRGDCKQTFPTLEDLTEHQETHPFNAASHHINPGSLVICPFGHCLGKYVRFETRGALNRHIEMTHLDIGDGQLICENDVCNRPFADFRALNVHRHYKHPNDPARTPMLGKPRSSHVCKAQNCGRKFLTRANRLNHIDLQHPSYEQHHEDSPDEEANTMAAKKATLSEQAYQKELDLRLAEQRSGGGQNYETVESAGEQRSSKKRKPTREDAGGGPSRRGSGHHSSRQSRDIAQPRSNSGHRYPTEDRPHKKVSAMVPLRQMSNLSMEESSGSSRGSSVSSVSLNRPPKPTKQSQAAAGSLPNQQQAGESQAWSTLNRGTGDDDQRDRENKPLKLGSNLQSKPTTESSTSLRRSGRIAGLFKSGKSP